MKSIWCDSLAGSWPPWDKCRKLGVTRIYVDARESVTSKPELSRLQPLVDGIHAQGFEAGIYRDPVWGGWSTPEDYALLASRDVKKAETDLVSGASSSKQVAYMHDLETHDTDWIMQALRAWRKPRPFRTTDVTWEPLQGGLWGELNSSPAKVTELIGLLTAGGPGGVYHQNYYGGMVAANAERVRADLIDHGFPDWRLWGFYDGLDLPNAWDGCIFTTGRLVV